MPGNSSFTVDAKSYVSPDGGTTWNPATGSGGGGAGGDASAANQALEIAALNSLLIELDKKANANEAQSVSGTLTTVRPSAAARVTVTAAAGDTSLLAANATRFGATIWNESDKTLYLALGTAAASLTSYTAQVAPGGYYETPFAYTGAIRGIWAATPTGFARVTEIT